MSISKLTASNLTVTLGISMRSGYTIWSTALIFYLVFLGWHENWRGPLTESEIAIFTARAQSINGLSAEQLAHFEMFMRDDDGGEFFMLNLMLFPDGKIAHPDTGAPIEPRTLVQSYSRPFIKQLLLRGGHPTLLMMRHGGDVDSWGSTAESGAQWGVTNVMRYRSRRDLANMAAMSAFAGIHQFKRAAILENISYPNKMMMTGFAGPRLFMATALILAAALGNLVILALS